MTPWAVKAPSSAFCGGIVKQRMERIDTDTLHFSVSKNPCFQQAKAGILLQFGKQ